MTEPVSTADLLVEIGCEELPPGALDDLSAALFAGVCDGLERERIAFDRDASRAYASPRRLAVLLREVATGQPDEDQERRGPAVAAAFDAEGRPTRAAEGFARSVGVAVEDLQRLENDKGAWLVARVHQPGQPLEAVLFPLLEQALKQLPVPRPMRWAAHDFSFVRPVHWLVVLYGERVLTGRLLGQDAGDTTRGHRIHAPGPHRIATPADYARTLESACVLADPFARRERIREQVLDADPDAVIDDDLLAEVNNLVEWPVAIRCGFDEAFLAVPHEALIASMQAHQKFFPVTVAADPGSITNRFVAVANLESKQVEEVRAGFERVIRPRLADARFFLEQDQSRSLDTFASGLEGVIFQSKIGTLADKTRRIASLSEKIATKLGIDASASRRAAQLAKCDLMSQMVGEFPELQGIMGRHYALHGGEPVEIADAIAGHYRPRFAGDDIPATPAGQVVGLADRADTLVGIFAAGQKPTGNKDPFALRRSALGLVRILLEAGLALPLDRVLALAANELAAQGVEVPPHLLAEVRDFIVERARQHFREAGYSTGLVSAVLASPWSTLPDLAARLEALSGFMGQEPAAGLAAANKRIGNILRKAEDEFETTIDEDRLVLEEERELYRSISESRNTVKPLLERDEYTAALNALAALRPVVDRFFDGVMVMDEDPVVRRNRLALLAGLKALFDDIADLSVLG